MRAKRSFFMLGIPISIGRAGVALAACVGLLMVFGPVSGSAQIAASEDIPDRPEKLTYPPLVYTPPKPAEYRVALRCGAVAYVVPDRELPLVNVVVSAHTGKYLEPVGKEGLADLTGYLLARGGTKSKTAEELEERLAFLAAQLNSSIGETEGTVSLNLLSKDLNEGLSILREVLSAPRFQGDKIGLRKQQLLQAMNERNDDSQNIEVREQGFLAYGDNFWANHYSTAASIGDITRADLEDFHKAWFYPSNLVLAVSGDFDRETMVQKLETLLADWPFTGKKPGPVPANTEFASSGIYLIDKEVNQGRVMMMLPGIVRDSPDYFAVTVMNDILGGGGFSSRIVNRVRSDEGLAYDAHSSFPGGIYYAFPFAAGFQSKSRTVAFAASLVLEEMKKIATDRVGESELAESKRGFIERLPRTFSTKAQVARTFQQDEFTGRYAKDPGYWQQFSARIESVSQADVLRAAAKYFKPPELVILIVGQKEQILLGQPEHPVKLTELVGGRVTDVPLRDPLTMKPLTAEAHKASAR